MPITPGLKPGKVVKIGGHVILPEINRAPSFNGTLNKYSGPNPNNTDRFKIFEDRDGVIQSQNQVLFNQDNYDWRENNKDLNFQLTHRYNMTALDQFEQLEPSKAINVRMPYVPPRINAVS